MNLTAAPSSVMLTREAILAIGSGNLIQAIKITRANTGLGLKAAKEAVEAYLEVHPEINEKFSANRTIVSVTQEQIIQLSIIAIAAIIAYLLFSGKFR